MSRAWRGYCETEEEALADESRLAEVFGMSGSGDDDTMPGPLTIAQGLRAAQTRLTVMQMRAEQSRRTPDQLSVYTESGISHRHRAPADGATNPIAGAVVDREPDPTPCACCAGSVPIGHGHFWGLCWACGSIVSRMRFANPGIMREDIPPPLGTKEV
jgi:hypothetical protein